MGISFVKGFVVIAAETTNFDRNLNLFLFNDFNSFVINTSKTFSSFSVLQFAHIFQL